MEKPVQYEVLLRNDKYVLQVYSNFGYPLRHLLFQAEYDTKEEAELSGVRILKNK